jgi:hypothetical protein
MTRRRESNSVQQIRTIKNRTLIRPKSFTYICYLSWQEFQYVNGTFDETENVDITEIRELLDEETGGQ